jgi:ClpX C4-type zinc finger protein
MSLTFNELKLAGSFIRDIEFIPSRTVRIEIRTAPQSGENPVSILYELVFDQVHSFRPNFDADPWLEIKSHRMRWPYRSRERKEIDAECGHFEFIFDEGTIDIIAEKFTGSALDEIPFLGPGDLANHSVMSHEPTFPANEESMEMKCGFCGRERAEVMKIIMGSEANICSDCVKICVGLIEP